MFHFTKGGGRLQPDPPPEHGSCDNINLGGEAGRLPPASQTPTTNVMLPGHWPTILTGGCYRMSDDSSDQDELLPMNRLSIIRHLQDPAVVVYLQVADTHCWRTGVPRPTLSFHPTTRYTSLVYLRRLHSTARTYALAPAHAHVTLHMPTYEDAPHHRVHLFAIDH